MEKHYKEKYMIKKIKNWFISFINNWKRVNKELEELESQEIMEKSENKEIDRKEVADSILAEWIPVIKVEESDNDSDKKVKPVKKPTKKKTAVKKKEKK